MNTRNLSSELWLIALTWSVIRECGPTTTANTAYLWSYAIFHAALCELEDVSWEQRKSGIRYNSCSCYTDSYSVKYNLAEC